MQDGCAPDYKETPWKLASHGCPKQHYPSLGSSQSPTPGGVTLEPPFPIASYLAVSKDVAGTSRTGQLRRGSGLRVQTHPGTIGMAGSCAEYKASQAADVPPVVPRRTTGGRASHTVRGSASPLPAHVCDLPARSSSVHVHSASSK